VKVPTLIFGIIPLPHLPLPAGAGDPASTAHALLAWIGIALIVLHVAGALRHHALLRDGLIWRMMPARSPVLLLALPALIAAAFLLGRLILPASAPQAVAVPKKVAAVEKAEPVNIVAATDTDNAAGEADPAPSENATLVAPIGPPPSWTVQPGGSIAFSVGNGNDSIQGKFPSWTARITMDPDRPESADIDVEIDLASATVGDAYQDGMLAGDEFFGVAAHPRARFTAKGAEKTGANSYRAAGALTLKGVSKPQVIRFTLSGSGEKRKVSGSASIGRTLFGVGNGESSAGLDPKVAVDFRFDAQAK
jgi:polyisoprenoid-binding protein YceI